MTDQPPTQQDAHRGAGLTDQAPLLTRMAISEPNLFRSRPQPMSPLTQEELANPLCDEHLARWNAWIDKYPFVLPFRINSGASYDDTAKGVVARKKKAIEDWKETIRFQQSLIKRICANQCSSSNRRAA